MTNVKYLKKIEEEEYSEHTEQFLDFVMRYVETGNASQSWIDAGYSQNSKGRAMSRLRDNWRLVEKFIKDRIGGHVPMALNGIITLAENAKQESIRLKAQQDILYRAGYDTPVAFVVEDKDASNLKDAELKDELARLLSKGVG